MTHPDWYIGLAVCCLDIALFLGVIFGMLVFCLWMFEKIARLSKIHAAFIDFMCENFRRRWWGK